MIQGMHLTLFTPDADGLRDYFRDKLRFPYADVGEGWLIFGLPTADVGCHPIAQGEQHRFRDTEAVSVVPRVAFFCDDIQKTVQELSGRGVEFIGEISDEGYGLVIRFKIPGGLEVELYQPRYEKKFKKPRNKKTK